MNVMEKIFAQKDEFIPRSGEGFNVVGLDTYEPPGEGLYLIGNYCTKKAAKAAAAAFSRANPGEIVHVYSPGDW